MRAIVSISILILFWSCSSNSGSSDVSDEEQDSVATEEQSDVGGEDESGAQKVAEIHDTAEVISNVKKSVEQAPEVQQSKVNRHIDMWKEGTNFMASGTEPFWRLAIDFDKQFDFTTMDGFSIITPPGQPVGEEDEQIYRSVTESGELIVEVVEAPCENAMSGAKFDYTVKVKVKNSTDSEYTEYAGCGEYAVDPRLHNIWVIEEFEGQPLDHNDFAKGIPQMEINIRDDRFAGHDGCNRISGKVSVKLDEITFGSGPMTLMECPNSEMSNEISLALVDHPYRFDYTGRRLHLSADGEVVFKLKNVD